MPKILVQFILNLFIFLYSGDASLIQASTSTQNLIFRKKYWSPIIGNGAQEKPKKAQNSDIKKLGNFDCGGASLMDLHSYETTSRHYFDVTTVVPEGLRVSKLYPIKENDVRKDVVNYVLNGIVNYVLNYFTSKLTTVSSPFLPRHVLRFLAQESFDNVKITAPNMHGNLNFYASHNNGGAKVYKST